MRRLFRFVLRSAVITGIGYAVKQFMDGKKQAPADDGWRPTEARAPQQPAATAADPASTTAETVASSTVRKAPVKKAAAKKAAARKAAPEQVAAKKAAPEQAAAKKATAKKATAKKAAGAGDEPAASGLTAPVADEGDGPTEPVQ